MVEREGRDGREQREHFVDAGEQHRPSVADGAHDNSTLPDPDEVARLAMLVQAAAASHEHLRIATLKRERETRHDAMPLPETAIAERRELERQSAATLTLVRRSIQQGYYGVVGAERDERALASAEGKAFLALITVFGTVLDHERFARDPAVNGYMGRELGCFDCELKLDMDRQAFGRELHRWTQAHNVKQALGKLESPRRFETGRDGERAARPMAYPWLARLRGRREHVLQVKDRAPGPDPHRYT